MAGRSSTTFMARAAHRALLASCMVFIGSALASADGAQSQVTDVLIYPARIAPGGAFKVTAKVRDDDGLMGGFILSLSNAQMPSDKNIEYIWSEFAGKKEATIALIVGPGENSRYGDAEITQGWSAGSVTRVRLLVRDINDDRTTIDVGEVKVVAIAPAASKAAKEEKPDAGPSSKGGWRVDFDDGTLGGAGEPRYVNRSEGRAEAERASWKIQDGVVSITGQFDEDSAKGSGDYVPLAWGELDVSLVDSPVLEMRFRASGEEGSILVQCTYEYADGSQQSPYFYATFHQPGQWTTLATRLVGDSSLPKKWTPRRLVRIHIWLMGDRPLSADFDWIRLRKLNQEEQKKEDEWIALLADYEPAESQRTKEFFPFGVYACEPDGSSWHKMSHRMNYRLLSKNHLNFVKATTGNVKAAEEMGIGIGMRMRLTAYRFEQGGTQAAIDWAKPIVDSVKDSPALICYDVGDERPISALWGIAAGNSILNQLDPTRDSVLTFWDPASIRAYGPYVAVDAADIYPLVDSGYKGAAYLYDWCRRVARDNGNKRQWMILQAFGAAPWRKVRGYIVPTVEQLRLQVYSALAGGARGIIFYSTSYDRYRMMTDQWGNPNELMKEAARLGEILIPIGRRLLDCVVDFDTTIACDNEKILIGVVHSPERKVRYVILANKDEESPRGGKLSGVDGTLYDMHSLEESPGGMVEPLQGGDGRIYMVATAEGFADEANIIRRYREEETKRAATPDRLFEARGCNPTQRDQLDETARIMGAIEPAMYWDNPDEKIVELMTPYRDRYWGIHARWVLAYEALLAGDPMPDKIAYDVLRHSKGLILDVREALGDRPMYPERKTN